MKRGLQRGAALLAAMLTVTLVATFAAAALWQQWRGIEIESADRTRVQSAWILGGALDWARLNLREDLRAGNAGHLAEPWAVPLQEARLATFLAADRNISVEGSDAENVFLSGQITDLQAKLNVNNLVEAGVPQQNQVAAFGRLFTVLNLPQSQLQTLYTNLQFALDMNVENLSARQSALPPQRLEELEWLGLPAETIAALAPYVTMLPGRTMLNLNTASAEAIYAVTPGIAMADAQKVVAARQGQYFRSTNEALLQMPSGTTFAANSVSVNSQFFEVRGRLRIDDVVIEERSIVQRNGLDVLIVDRERGPGASPAQPVAPR